MLRDQFERLSGRIAISLQPPALERSPLGREDGADVRVLDDDVARGGVGGGNDGCLRGLSRGRRGAGDALLGCGRTTLGRCRIRRGWKQQLIAVQHDERQDDGEQDAAFHLRSLNRRDGIEPRLSERMAPANPPNRQPGATNRPVGGDGLDGVGGARRHESTGAAKKRGQHQLIGPNQKDGQSCTWCHRFDPPWQRLTVARKSCSRLENDADSKGALGMTTRSSATPSVISNRKTSRINRLARFLTTAPPSFLEATIPRRARGAPSGAPMIVRSRPWARRPVSKTR